MKRNYLKTYPWKWVCVQHPMILLSDDRSKPRALETVSPWGAEDIPGYCRKMYEMLEKLDQASEMKVDFDLSAKELMIFLEHEPDGRALIRKLYEEGRLDFVGTDYSQSHYGTARSESALREIRMGAEVYREELGITADTFCHQEVGIYQNLPQVLAAFGTRKSASHRFPYAFEYLELPTLELYSHFGQLSFLNRETMANWCGLDGTCIPMYMPCVNNDLMVDTECMEVFRKLVRPGFADMLPGMPPIRREYPTGAEEGKGMCHGGSIIIQIPDMVDLDDSYIRMRSQTGDFWCLSDAIEEEMKLVSRMPKIRYYTYWSYAEGRFGENMFKAYRACEEKLLAAETMQVMARLCGKPLSFETRQAWDKLLTAQHHDINWMDHKELWGRALNWTLDAKAEAEQWINQAGCAMADALVGTEPAQAVAVFNTLPVARTAYAAVQAPGSGYRVTDETGADIPSQMDNGSLIFPASMDGLGFRCYRLENIETELLQHVQREPYHFENDVMQVTILPDGRLRSIRSKKNGELLNGCGNVLCGDLIFAENESRQITNEDAASEMTIISGPLYDKVVIHGSMEDIPYAMTIRLPHGSGTTIAFDLELTFDHHEIGDMVHDESKLNLYWDLANKPTDILVDEPFGMFHARADRPVLAANFLTAWDGRNGVMLEHTGTPKNWVCGNQLVTQLAWGSDIIFNRMPFLWEGLQCYDMRLDGKCAYHYQFSLVENMDVPDLFAKSSSHVTPLVTLPAASMLPGRTFLTLENRNLVPTAVELQGDEIAVRMFDVSGQETPIQYTTQLESVGKTDVAGNQKTGSSSGAYEIFELHFRS